ncbi:leucine-rich repeat-containing protein 40 isoform X2 [Hydra vulgaris]|uniref:Leucine-rich repeat-containing protein 40 isoform X2 n=1 Tax=Hydra vulgaris TaxID=6087 RepID=A0ABM4B462_HYDVU
MNNNSRLNKNRFKPLPEQSEEKKVGVPTSLLKSARHTGQLNLSGRSLKEVPLDVWRINLDIPSQTISLGEVDERWWDQVDLRKLILASNEIKCISNEVKYLPALTVLDAHDNCIEYLSDEISELKELGKLHLSHNKLTSLPDSLCQTTALKVLLLAGNLLQSLPVNFGFLINLEELDLSDNKLTSLPENFGSLVQIKKLDLSKNLLTSLPNSFDSLKSLIDLNLSANKLTVLPKGFGKLTSLEIFECSYNLITTFTTFDDQTNIKQLFLGYNRIQKIEDNAFEKMQSLVSLSLRDNAIAEIPESFTKLRTLERADLSNNSLSTLPNAVGKMNLKALTLDGNSMRSIRRDIVDRGTNAILAYLKSRLPEEKVPDEEIKIPKSVSKVNDIDQQKKIQENSKAVTDQFLIATTKNLSFSGGSGSIPSSFWLPGAQISKISIQHNGLTVYPLEIMNYASTLSELDISHNKISNISDSVNLLTKLVFLDLSHNVLSSLPSSISQLEHLLELVLSFNKYSSIPPCLFKCKKLQTLLLSNNQITDIDVVGLLEMKCLRTLDLSNNNIACVPPQLGNVEWLQSLNLDGNPFRNPRAQILMKGTQNLLAYLRDRIPT